MKLISFSDDAIGKCFNQTLEKLSSFNSQFFVFISQQPLVSEVVVGKHKSQPDADWLNLSLLLVLYALPTLVCNTVKCAFNADRLASVATFGCHFRSFTEIISLKLGYILAA